MKLFPDDDRKGRILCHALTTDFLYYGTDVRLLTIFFLRLHESKFPLRMVVSEATPEWLTDRLLTVSIFHNIYSVYCFPHHTSGIILSCQWSLWSSNPKQTSIVNIKVVTKFFAILSFEPINSKWKFDSTIEINSALLSTFKLHASNMHLSFYSWLNFSDSSLCFYV